jgi:hypothetical protein
MRSDTLVHIQNGNASPAYSSSVHWSDLLHRVQVGDEVAVDELYGVISQGILFFLRRSMSVEHAKHQHHKVFAILVDEIQSGRIRDPLAFPSYAVMVAKRQAQQYLQNVSIKPADYQGRPLDDSSLCLKVNFDAILESAERNALMQQTVTMLKPQEREILNRIYILGQTSEDICTDMALTETQFRALKSRAKGRFSNIRPETVTPVKVQNPVSASHRLAKTSAA